MDASSLPSDFSVILVWKVKIAVVYSSYLCAHSGHALPMMESACRLPNDRTALTDWYLELELELSPFDGQFFH